MNLRRAKEYIEKALPVLVKHIKGKYHPDFVAPEIEFYNSWVFHNSWGEYDFSDGKIVIRRASRIYVANLAYVLTHELGHALLNQINPEFRSVDLEDEDYDTLCEGIADVLGDEGLEVLEEKGLYPYSTLGQLRVCLNLYLDPTYWLHKLTRMSLPYSQGEKSVEELRGRGMSLEDIMKQAHKPEFAHSIPHSYRRMLDFKGHVIRYKKKSRG